MSIRTLFNRRRTSRVLCLLAGAGFVVASLHPRLVQARAVPIDIDGSWLVTVAPAGGVPPPFPALVTYGSGGALLVTDSSFPPAVGNVYQGTWERTGPRQFTFTFLGFQYDPAGAHSGYVRVFETVSVDRSGDEYEGTATFQLLDTNFNVVFSEPNTTHGRRVHAQ